MTTTPYVLFAGGGTGGHVFPLIALAEALARLAPSAEFAFVGTERGLEARLVRARRWKLETLPVEQLKGRSVLGALRGAALAGAATVRATKLVGQRRPSLVVSIGGYAAGPVSLAAAALGVPIALVEPNRISGFTQKVLTPIAKRVYVGFAESVEALGDKGRAFGVPLREGFAPTPPRENQGEVHILVMGGSQGAEALNQTIPAALARVAQQSKIKVVHQVGRDRVREANERWARAFDAELARSRPEEDEDTRERARRKGPPVLPVEVVEFLDDVPARLAWADLVVSRSGALTCAELCAVGRPAVLVPYPHAADDHQFRNAHALAEAGAAIVLRQETASTDALADAIGALCTDANRRRAMADASRARGVPDAADKIMRDLLALIGVPVAAHAAGGAEA
ncbi:MAG: undecaprenyldiphospho-muramoylpentapeptide beta-N-acetylglucosaminyltransferase [Polyangiales bacterium]